MAYNRDLQEDKLAMFDAFDTTAASLELAAAIVRGAEIQQDVIEARLEDGFLDATALMEYLIKQGVPMRTAHGTVGSLVALCDEKKCRLADLSLTEMQTVCDLIQEDVSEVLGTRNAVASLQSYGSGGRKPVESQLEQWRERLKNKEQ